MSKFKKYIKFGLVAVLAAGCDTKSLHDLNINPQALNEIDLNYLFTSAELGIASNGSSGDNRYIDWRSNIGMFGYAIQQLASSGGGISRETSTPATMKRMQRHLNLPTMTS
jgi:hypothetical protein